MIEVVLLQNHRDMCVYLQHYRDLAIALALQVGTPSTIDQKRASSSWETCSVIDLLLSCKLQTPVQWYASHF